MRPSSANPAGHWESLPIAEINDEILARLGGTWAKPPELAPGWERSSELAALRQQARELIEADFSGSDVWGFKDPRNSLTLPFWQGILPPDALRDLPSQSARCRSLAQGPQGRTGASRSGSGPLVHIRARRSRRDRGAPARARLLRGPDGGSGAGRRSVGALHRARSSDDDPEVRVAIRVALTEGLWHHRTAYPTSSTRQSPLPRQGALSGSAPVRSQCGERREEVLDLVGSYADDAGRRLAELAADREELEQLRERSRRPGARAAASSSSTCRLSELSAELERSVESHAEEQRRRRRLEAELDTTRAALRRRELPAHRTAPAPGQAPKASSSPRSGRGHGS